MVTLKKIDKEEFEKISNELNNDPEVKKFVNFYCLCYYMCKIL